MARLVLAALAALLILPAAARADCPGQALDRTFLPWGDPALYTPVPASWTLPGGVALAPGAPATTAPVCIGLGHPTVRFFARNTGNPLALLRVSAVVGESELPIGLVPAGRAWAPSPPLLLGVNLLGAGSVAFRFTTDGGSWSVGDVYVDPYRKG